MGLKEIYVVGIWNIEDITFYTKYFTDKQEMLKYRDVLTRFLSRIQKIVLYLQNTNYKFSEFRCWFMIEFESLLYAQVFTRQYYIEDKQYIKHPHEIIQQFKNEW